MFKEYADFKGIDIAKLDKVLLANRDEDCSALVFRHKKLKTHVGIVEFELILAFMFLVNELADKGVAADAYLAKALNDLGLRDKEAVMEQYVKFRRANGIELEEDLAFLKSKDIGLYEFEKCECTNLEADPIH